MNTRDTAACSTPRPPGEKRRGKGDECPPVASYPTTQPTMSPKTGPPAPPTFRPTPPLPTFRPTPPLSAAPTASGKGKGSHPKPTPSTQRPTPPYSSRPTQPTSLSPTPSPTRRQTAAPGTLPTPRPSHAPTASSTPTEKLTTPPSFRPSPLPGSPSTTTLPTPPTDGVLTPAPSQKPVTEAPQPTSSPPPSSSLTGAPQSSSAPTSTSPTGSGTTSPPTQQPSDEEATPIPSGFAPTTSLPTPQGTEGGTSQPTLDSIPSFTAFPTLSTPSSSPEPTGATALPSFSSFTSFPTGTGTEGSTQTPVPTQAGSDGTVQPSTQTPAPTQAGTDGTVQPSTQTSTPTQAGTGGTVQPSTQTPAPTQAGTDGTVQPSTQTFTLAPTDRGTATLDCDAIATGNAATDAPFDSFLVNLDLTIQFGFDPNAVMSALQRALQKYVAPSVAGCGEVAISRTAQNIVQIVNVLFDKPISDNSESCSPPADSINTAFCIVTNTEVDIYFVKETSNRLLADRAEFETLLEEEIDRANQEGLLQVPGLLDLSEAEATTTSQAPGFGTEDRSNSESSGIGAGGIVGVAVASCVVLLFVLALIARRRRRRNSSTTFQEIEDDGIVVQDTNDETNSITRGVQIHDEGKSIASVWTSKRQEPTEWESIEVSYRPPRSSRQQPLDTTNIESAAGLYDMGPIRSGVVGAQPKDDPTFLRTDPVLTRPPLLPRTNGREYTEDDTVIL